MKKVNNYHIFLLIIVFILNTILFRSIDITKAQWALPIKPPGQETSNIVTSPLSAPLNLGGYNIFGEAYVGLGITTDMIENPFIVSNNIGSGGIISSFYDPYMVTSDIMYLRIGKDKDEGNAGLLSFYYNGNNSGENYLGLGINNAADTLIITKDGNVGIGANGLIEDWHRETTSPQNDKNVQLVLPANSRLGWEYVTAGDTIIRHTIGKPSNGDGPMVFTVEHTGTPEEKIYEFQGDLEISKMVILQSGNVGIGTDNPIGQLNAVRSSNSYFNVSGDPAGFFGMSTVAGIKDGESGLNTFGGSIGFSRSDSNSVRAAITAVQTGDNVDHVGLAFFTHPSATSAEAFEEKMRITHDGKLDVSGGINFGVTNDDWLVGGNINIDQGLLRADSHTHDITIMNGGSVGIGTTEPNRKLHIKTNSNDEFINAEIGIQSGNNNYWGIYHDNDTDDLRFWHNEENKLTITDNGSVSVTGKITDSTSQRDAARAACYSALANSSSGSRSLIMVPLPGPDTDLDAECHEVINPGWHAGGVSKSSYYYQNCGDIDNDSYGGGYTSFTEEAYFENPTNQGNDTFASCGPTNAFICCSMQFPN